MPAEPVRIWPATEAEQIAIEEIIPHHHPELGRARILWLLTSQDRKSKGKLVYATTKLLGPLERYLSSGDACDVDDGYDYEVMITNSAWEWLTPEQRRAVVDHELSHCCRVVSDDGERWSLVTHDVEEFGGVLERHGNWTQALKDFNAIASAQLRLPV